MGMKIKELLERVAKKTLQWTIWKNDFITKWAFEKRYKKLQVTEKNNDSEFSRKLEAGEIKNIKMIGDSITVGVGSWSYQSDNKSAIILTDSDGRTYREPSSKIWSWTNFFKKYINTFHPDVSFDNYGIGGKSAKWFNERKNKLISDNEDVVFIMLGTNDRWDVSSIGEYKSNLEELLYYVSNRSNLMYVISPPPALNDDRFIFGMSDVNDAVEKICRDNGYILISQYKNIINFSNKENVPLEKLLQTNGGSHPIQKGYNQMWLYFQKTLGLYKK